MVNGLYTILQLNIELKSRELKRKQTDNSKKIDNLNKRLNLEEKHNRENEAELLQYDNEISRLLNEESKNTSILVEEQNKAKNADRQLKQSNQNLKFLKKTGKNQKKINKQKKKQREIKKYYDKELKVLSDLKTEVAKKNSIILSNIKNTYKKLTSLPVADTDLTKNEINYFEGKDFYWIFKDRFNQEYKVYNSEVEKDSAALLALNKYIETVQDYKNEETDVFKEMILEILIDKIDFNLQTVLENEGYDSEINIEYKNGDAKYPIFVDFIPSSGLGPLILVDIDV